MRADRSAGLGRLPLTGSSVARWRACYGQDDGDSSLTARRQASRSPPASAGPGTLARPGDRRRCAASPWCSPLTAFSGEGSSASDGLDSDPRCPSPHRSPSRSSSPPSGNLRVQSPIAEDGVTAVGFHGLRRGRARPPARRPAGERRACWRGSGTGSPARRTSGLPWYQLESGALRTIEVGAARWDRRLLAGRRDRRRRPRPHHRGASLRRRDRAAALVSAVARRGASARRARSGAERRRERRRRLVEARHRGRRDPRRATGSRAVLRLTAASNVAIQRLPIRDARRAVGSRRSCASSSSPTSSAPPGGSALEDRLAEAPRRARAVDVCVVNGENAADGVGITPRLADQHARHGRRRDHARQPRFPTQRRSAPTSTPRIASCGLRTPRCNSPGRGLAVVPAANGARARRDQRARLPVPPPGHVDVRGDRRARRGGASRDAGGPRRRARRGDEREGRARALARRASHRAWSGRTRTSRPRTHACCPEGPRSSRTPA